METVVINGTPRTELGKKATRALRKAGNVPCNLYGGAATLNFQAPVASFRKLIYTPDFRIAEINVEGKSFKAIVKEVQFEPVKDSILHIDFQELVDTTPVKVSVPLRLNGNPKGVADGGKLEQVIRRVNIVALPANLPSAIELNIADMQLGSIKRISDIQLEGVKILLSGSNPVARVNVPRALRDDAAAAAKTDEKKK